MTDLITPIHDSGWYGFRFAVIFDDSTVTAY